MIVIAQDSTFSGPEKLVRRWFESWHGPDRGLGGLAVFGCKLPGVAGGPGRRADVLVWTPGHCTVVEIAGLRRSQSGVLDTADRWRIGSAPADLDLPVASLTPDVRAAQTATGLRARLKRAGLPDLVGELAVLVTAPGSAVSHPEPLEPTGVVVAGSADHDAVERYFRRQDGARWDVATLTAAFTELELAELLPPVEALVREGFAAAGEISAAEVAAQGAVTPAAGPASGGGGVAPPGTGTGEVEAVPSAVADAPGEGFTAPSGSAATSSGGAATRSGLAAAPSEGMVAPAGEHGAALPVDIDTGDRPSEPGRVIPAAAGTRSSEPHRGGPAATGTSPDGPDPAGVPVDPVARAGADASDRTLADDAREPAPADEELEPDDPRRTGSPAPERVPAMAAAARSRPPWLAPIPPLPERPRRVAARKAEPSAITEVDTPRPGARAAQSVPGRADSGVLAAERAENAPVEQPVWAGTRNAAPAQTLRPEPAAGSAQAESDQAASTPRSPIAGAASALRSPAAARDDVASPPRMGTAAPPRADAGYPPRASSDNALRADSASAPRAASENALRQPPASPWAPPSAQPRSRGVRLTRTPSPQPPHPTQNPRPTPPPAEQRPPRRLEYSADPQPLRPRAHYSPPPSRGEKLRAAFDTESWPRFQVGGTAVLLTLAALVAVFFVVVHVARENRPALADYAAMCDKPQPFTGAAEPKPGPVGVYAAGDLNAVSPPGDPALPRAARPEDVQWVACATRTGVGAPVANCRYPDGSELALIAGRYRLTVYEARTGRTVSSADVPGDWFAPGTIPIGDPCAAAAGAAPDQPGQRFGRPAPDQLRQFLSDAARSRGLPS
ncbi:hypothetical protein AB0H71_03710 [Nocardia sp. NPDC050697]|uniref:hypothetical protein n=1 Tax=Nocardia sp. NPDC050697 TaxID=3155158 RepID=UPI0033E13555